RREWRTLPRPAQHAYLTAVRCLQTLPSRAPASLAPGARHRYDDFNSVHILASRGLIEGTGGIHLVGHFLAWHRYYVAAFESALRHECGYRGAQPYWNWSIDVASGAPMDAWPVFSNASGFGGNGPPHSRAPTPSWPDVAGATGGGCVPAGPFREGAYTAHVGPGQNTSFNPHCLHRSFNPTVAALKLTKALTDAALAAESFTAFSDAVQGPQVNTQQGIDALTFHGGGHYAPGGDATDFISSPTDPTFWLHHAYIDYLYWQWQSKDLEVRVKEVGGPVVPFSGPTGRNVTLGFEVDLMWEGGSRTVGDLMHIRRGGLCYGYKK
ncbi:hypothetical protein EDC01DRAFT_591559, partial [Geopyxis carbonaria]